MKFDIPSIIPADIARKASLDAARAAKGLEKRNYKLTGEQKKEIARLYAAGGITQRELGERFGITQPSIGHILRNRDVPIKRVRQHSLREDAFDQITEESAYWIGFLMADGNVHISKTATIVSLGLAVRDIGHVEKFRRFMGSTHAIYLGKQKGAHLSFSSPRIAARLAEFGIMPRKSLIAKVLLLENDRHFWRGLVDGDGSLGFWKHKKRRRGAMHLVGSHVMMRQFSEYIGRALGIAKLPVGRNGKISVTGAAGWRAVQIVKLLYSGCSVSLDRKLKLATEMMAWGDANNYSEQKCPTKCSPEQIADIVSRYHSGVPSTVIAEEFRIDSYTVLTYLKKRGIATPRRKYRKFSASHCARLSIGAKRRQQRVRELRSATEAHRQLRLFALPVH